MQSLWQDLRFGVRLMWKRPGFTLLAVLMLSLGIGANTAIFSVVNSVLLRPLRYPDADRILTVWEDHTRRDGPAREWTSPPGFEDWRAQRNVFSQVAAVNDWPPTLTDSGEPEVLTGARVSHEAFGALGIKPLLGRDFTPDEDKNGAPPVAIISYGLWQRRFNGDPAIINRAIRLNDTSFTVIGVMPAGFQFPLIPNVEIWRTLQPTLDAGCQRGCYTLRAFGRLRPDITLARARLEMAAQAERLEQQFPGANKNVGVSLVPLHEYVVGDIKPAVLALLLAVGFVLLIACANVANLLLAKAAARTREIAIRAALGASRWQIVRQLLGESVLLALLGGVGGLLLAYWLVDLLVQVAPEGTPRLDEIRLEPRVLFFSLGLSALTGVLCGLAPALQASKSDLNQALRDAGAGNKTSAGGGRTRSGLVVAEIALALTLLIGAGLLMRSFVALQHVDPGFSPANVLTARIGLPPTTYATREPVAAFYRQLRERLAALPGVQSVSFGSSVPLTGINTDTDFVVEGRPLPPPDQRPTSWFSVVEHDYFRTLQIQLRAGRMFDEREREQSAPTVIISESLARRYFPGETPLGKRIGFGNQPVRWAEIVGVVADTRHFGLSADARPTLYFSDQQRPRNFMTLVLRTSNDPLGFVAAVRREVQALDPKLAVATPQPLTALIADSIAVPRLVMLLFGSFAAIALLLAALGIYGVMAYAVTQRTHEIGIRLALGAQRRAVLRLIVGQGMRLALLGVGLGLAASFAVTRLMAELLFGVSPTDPLTFVALAAVLALVALIACVIPARRATKVDPIIALRYE